MISILIMKVVLWNSSSCKRTIWECVALCSGTVVGNVLTCRYKEIILQ